MELAALKAVKWQMVTPSVVQSKKKIPGRTRMKIQPLIFYSY